MNAVIDSGKISSANQAGPVVPGRLEFARGGSNVTISGDPSLTDLYRADFIGRTPDVRRAGSSLVIEYPHFLLFGWSRTRAHIRLNPDTPWQITLRRGVANLMGDLRKLDVLGFEVMGGASNLELWLPEPHGTVAVRISGGVSRLRLHRPAGVAARIQIGGGASKLGLDRQFLGAIGGPIQLETPDYASAVDRYELDIRGGASKVTIDNQG